MAETMSEWGIGEVALEGSSDIGLFVFDRSNDEIVCDFYEHMGSHFAEHAGAEGHARLVAAAPALKAALTRMVQVFDGASRSMGLDYTEALAEAFSALRITLSDEERAAELDAIVALAEGRVQ